MLLNNYALEEKIFIDANIFIFNALDDPRFGENATSFLEKVEKGRIKGVITPIVIDEIFFKLLVAEASNVF